MLSSSICMAHRSAMLPSCSLYLPICSRPTAPPSEYRSVFFLLSPLRGGKRSLGCPCASVRGWWTSQSLLCLPGLSWLSNQQSSRPGLGSHPPAQPCYLAGSLCWSNCFWQKSSCAFRTASLNADCWNGRRQLWPCLLERLNLQRMCWVLTPHGPCECSVLFWTLAFSIRVKYIVCYYHTVKLIFTILCMIYLKFHRTKQASGVGVL